ncbi:hypothetical protein GQ600_9706 [Phytophthora cactorum]|nr:hypothetical protein GQ600_9706 [Phytophthora cactorum]
MCGHTSKRINAIQDGDVTKARDTSLHVYATGAMQTTTLPTFVFAKDPEEKKQRESLASTAPKSSASVCFSQSSNVSSDSDTVSVASTIAVPRCSLGVRVTLVRRLAPSATSPRVHPPRPWKSAHTLNVGVDSDFTFSQTSFTSFTSSPFRLASPPRGKALVESEASSTCSSPRFGILENETQKKGPALWPQDVERGPA